MRDESGQARLPVLLMVGGGVVLVAALLFVAFGRSSKKSDSSAAVAARCSFPACRASADPGLGRGYEGESVAVDPKDENHIVVTDANMSAGHCMWHVTFNRGKDWTDGVFQEPPGYTGCHINGAAGGHVPTGPDGVSFGPSGVVYATYGSASQPDQGTRESVLLAISTDGGKNFKTSVAAKPPGNDVSYARPQLSVLAGPTGKDRLLFSFWLCNQGGRFCPGALFARSDDGGVTFTAPVSLSDAQVAVRSPSVPVMTPDGTLYVTTIADFDDGTSDLILVKSTDAGATFSRSLIDHQTHIGDKYDPGKLAFDARSGSLFVVYSDQRAGSNQQVFFRKSTDKGNTWLDAVGIAPDQNALTNGASRTPNISVAPNGRVDIVYYRTPQASTDNVFWAYSLDGGSKFTSRQVNDAPIQRFEFNHAIGTWYPPALTSLDDAAVVVWSDTKNQQKQDQSTQDVYLRRMLPAGSDVPP